MNSQGVERPGGPGYVFPTWAGSGFGPMGTEGLPAAELEVWHAWKQSADRIRQRVARDIAAATGLCDPYYGVLSGSPA